eukprot:gene19679-21625_t
MATAATLNSTWNANVWKNAMSIAIPVVADLLGIKPRNTSIVVVISPLIALMNDQVKYLQRLGISATSATDENGDCTIEDIMNGITPTFMDRQSAFFQHLFGEGCSNAKGYRLVLLELLSMKPIVSVNGD